MAFLCLTPTYFIDKNCIDFLSQNHSPAAWRSNELAFLHHPEVSFQKESGAWKRNLVAQTLSVL